jgi:WD40 repeat protein
VDHGIRLVVFGLYLLNNVFKLFKVFIYIIKNKLFFLKLLFLHIKGHSKAVWAIISIGDPTNNSKIILTGGADNLIIAWKNYTKFQTYEGK